MVVALSSAAPGQEVSRPPATGWEVVGLPALNFDSDEGFGYGVLAEAYNYGNGARPYRYTIQPTIFFTTKGRRDFVVFFDAPTLLPHDVRLDAFAGREQQLATPYYGIGNDAGFNDQLQQPPNAYYYRYGRTQLRLLANLQHRVGQLPARVLVGGGFADVRTDPTPFDSGTTLLAQQLGGNSAPRGRIVYVRTGLVWDTRDREIAPHAGSYGDLLVQRVDRAFGASNSYTRFTAIGRHYYPLAARLTLAQRAVVQQASGDVPLYDIATIPFFSEDVEAQGYPEPVQHFKTRIAAADSLLIATPEYNYSMPGVLKNALDWASRPASSTPLGDKPLAIFGASTGPWGTARAQLHLRQSCVFFNAHPLNKPVLQINFADRKFDADGKLTDEPTRVQLHALLHALSLWTIRLRGH